MLLFAAGRPSSAEPGLIPRLQLYTGLEAYTLYNGPKGAKGQLYKGSNFFRLYKLYRRVDARNLACTAFRGSDFLALRTLGVKQFLM